MHTTRRAILGATTATFALAAIGCARQNGAGGSTELTAILDRLSTQFLRESPEYATSLAVSEEQAGGRYVDRLSDVSREGQQRALDVAQTGLTELRALNRDNLEAADRVTYDVVVSALEDNVAASSFRHGAGAQAPYTVTQLTGAYTNIPDFLASQHPVTNREQADAYLTRLAAYPAMMDQETARIGLDATDGIIQPDFTVTGAINQLRGFSSRPAAQNVLVQSFQTRLAEVADISAADKTALTQRAETIVRDQVFPAYQRQVEALQQIQPRAVHDAGVWRLPRGAELYAAALKAYTTTTMAPDDIHQMGLDIIAQNHGEMETILRGQGMTRGTLAERINALGQRPDQRYPSTEAGRAELLAALNAQVEAIRARMPEVCGVQARAALEIKRVPEYTEAGAPGGYYQGAALDGSRPGAYYINLRDPANEWPKFTLPTLTYHEGVPGHHWQIAIQQESGSIPFIRSALLGFSAYSEGWGLYSEQLADEMGMYANDPFGRVGYLQSMTFRASRLVVDTGMHHKRWTREQAIDSMMQATGDQRSNVTTEIERYCVWPGQACSYMVGRQAINRMRDGARQTLGDRFDLRGFHDTLLTNGATPLSVSEQLVNEWAASLQQA